MDRSGKDRHREPEGEQEERGRIKGVTLDLSGREMTTFEAPKHKQEAVAKLLLQNNLLTSFSASAAGAWRDTLTFVDLSYNQLDCIPLFQRPASRFSGPLRPRSEPVSWPHLRVLKMAHNKLTHINPDRVPLHLPELCALILNDNDLSPHSLKELPELPLLNTLVLSKNARVNSLRKVPKRCPSLRKLSASHTAVARLPSTFRRLEGQLKELRLSHTQVAVLSAVCPVDSLQILDLTDSPLAAASPSKEPQLLALLPNVRVLNGKNLRSAPKDIVRPRGVLKASLSDPSSSVIDASSSSSSLSSSSSSSQIESKHDKQVDKKKKKSDDEKNDGKNSDKKSDESEKKSKSVQKRDRRTDESGVIQINKPKRARNNKTETSEVLRFLSSEPDDVPAKW